MSAPGRRPEKEITLTLSMPYRHQTVEDAIRKFELKYPEEKVKYDYDYKTQKEYRINVTQNDQQFTTRIMAGDRGDIVLTGGGNIDYLNIFKTDAFLDLTNLIQESEHYETLNKGVLKGITINGAIRGLPVFYNPNYIEFNKELADSLGLKLNTNNLKWSEVLGLVEQLEEKNSDVTVFATTYKPTNNIEIVGMRTARSDERSVGKECRL